MRFHTTFILPEVIPAGHVLVHNSVRPYPGRGHPDGFHPRFLPPDAPGLVVCDCGWFLPERFDPHYRLERVERGLRDRDADHPARRTAAN
jgi:hypothetical protein